MQPFLLPGEKLKVTFRDLMSGLNKPSPPATGIAALHSIEFHSQGSVENYWTIDAELGFPQSKGEREIIGVSDSTVGFPFWKRATSAFAIIPRPVA